MDNARRQLGNIIKCQREHLNLSQDALAKQLDGVNRSNIAHLEQGLRLPKPEILERIAKALGVPEPHWKRFLDPEIQDRLDFEEQLFELCGKIVSLDGQDSTAAAVADQAIKKLFSQTHSHSQAHELLNSILIFYDVRPASKAFYKKYFSSSSFASIKTFGTAVSNFQQEAVRLFSTFSEAYDKMNEAADLTAILDPLKVRDVSDFSQRGEWALPNQVEEKRLPDLGYISAERVKQEAGERDSLRSFLMALAANPRSEELRAAIEKVPEKTRRRMDSLLRKFDTHFEHGLFSPLFGPDPTEIEREAERLAPKTDDEIASMAQTQRKAMENFAFYLASDYIDVYVATSMRTDADFVSVNTFVNRLFAHETVRPLRLRFFNPTQSWIEDRIAKGLVEALMLRRAGVTIYMAQKADTFGKDSEASVALGQGKPVIVYVPRLTFPDGSFDTESLFRKSRGELLALLEEKDKEDIDESVDEQAIFSKILAKRLEQLDVRVLAQVVESHWADFDLLEEERRVPEEHRKNYRKWAIQSIETGTSSVDISLLRSYIAQIFISNAVTFERRAKLFREIHPLALQVILSSGVLNGILVVRTIEQCAEILKRLIHNDLQLELKKDAMNYRLVEKITDSTIRVISRHKLLLNAFSAHYRG